MANENRGRNAFALPPRKNLRGGFAVCESVYQTEAACQALGEGERGNCRVLAREAGALAV